MRNPYKSFETGTFKSPKSALKLVFLGSLILVSTAFNVPAFEENQKPQEKVKISEFIQFCIGILRCEASKRCIHTLQYLYTFSN